MRAAPSSRTREPSCTWTSGCGGARMAPTVLFRPPRWALLSHQQCQPAPRRRRRPGAASAHARCHRCCLVRRWWCVVWCRSRCWRVRWCWAVTAASFGEAATSAGEMPREPPPRGKCPAAPGRAVCRRRRPTSWGSSRSPTRLSPRWWCGAQARRACHRGHPRGHPAHRPRLLLPPVPPARPPRCMLRRRAGQPAAFDSAVGRT